MTNPKDRGEIAYEGYKKFTRGLSLATGDLLPEWGKLEESIQDAWRASAQGVMDSMTLAPDPSFLPTGFLPKDL